MPSKTFFHLPAEKRERLLLAAEEEFARVPYAEASINRMIRAAGIPRGSFYMYFRDKEELFHYLLKRYQDGLLQRLERVLEELAAIAFANGTDFATITHNGLVRLTPTDEVPEEKKKAVASIKEGQYGTEIKLHDKVRALELLGKHLGVFDANNGSANEQENNIFEVIEESTREEIGTDEIPEIEPPAKPGHDLVE